MEHIEEEKPELGEPKKCPECGSTALEKEHGELFCKKCGIVVD